MLEYIDKASSEKPLFMNALVGVFKLLDSLDLEVSTLSGFLVFLELLFVWLDPNREANMDFLLEVV